MNPKNAYIKERKKGVSWIILILLLIIQSLIYTFKDHEFELIQELKKHFQINYLDELNIKIDNLFFSLNRDLKSNKIELKFFGRKIKAYNNIINFSSFNLNNIYNVKNIYSDKITFDFQNIDLNLRNFEIKNQNVNFLIQFDININNIQIKCIGDISRKNIEEFFQTKRKTGNIKYFIDKFTEQISHYKSKIKELDGESSYLMRFIYHDDISISIHQLRNSIVNKYTEGLSFELIAPKNKLENYNIDLSINKKSLPFNKNSILINNIRFSKNYIGDDFHDYSASFTDVQFRDHLKGEIPGLKININEDDKIIRADFLSESNQTKISPSVKYYKVENSFEYDGILNIFPRKINLNYFRKDGYQKCFDGRFLNLSFNNTGRNSNHFKLKAEEFSIIQSPQGNYIGHGTIDNNFTISFINAHGKMGKSDVNGVFKQSFFPFEYLFQVNGKCLPTDLNNWFGSWWSDIWDNFIFDYSNIPNGNVSIAGIWGQKNQTTVDGIIDAKNSNIGMHT